jgi:hypothetical protein
MPSLTTFPAYHIHEISAEVRMYVMQVSLLHSVNTFGPMADKHTKSYWNKCGGFPHTSAFGMLVGIEINSVCEENLNRSWHDTVCQ